MLLQFLQKTSTQDGAGKKSIIMIVKLTVMIRQLLSDYCVSGPIFSGFLLLHLMRCCTHPAKPAWCAAWCIFYMCMYSYNLLPYQDRTCLANQKVPSCLLSSITTAFPCLTRRGHRSPDFCCIDDFCPLNSMEMDSCKLVRWCLAALALHCVWDFLCVLVCFIILMFFS